MSFKRQMKGWLPPIVYEAMKHQRGRRCATWEEAGVHAGAYATDLVNRFRVERSLLRQADGALLQNHILNLVANLAPRRTFNVTDFGGATGDLGMEFLAAFPDSTWHVVENATLVEMMRDRGPIAYSTTIPETCDIFFTSGTLQYVDNPMEILRRGFDASFAVILTRNSFSETESFHVQHSWLFDNGAGPIPPNFRNRRISYPHRTIRESEVMAMADAGGWKCVARLEETTGVRGDAYGKQLVFLRKSV